MANFSSASISGSINWRATEGLRATDETTQRSTRLNADSATEAPGRAADSVELSDRARLLAALRPADSAPESDQTVRPDLVERIRAEIAAGTYASPTKDAIAADRLAKALNLGLNRQV